MLINRMFFLLSFLDILPSVPLSTLGNTVDAAFLSACAPQYLYPAACGLRMAWFHLSRSVYLLRNEKVSQAIVGSCWLSYEWKACFAFISINMYNGKRGFIRGKAAKYFFYLFYPVHITILVIIRNLFFL